MIKEFKKIDWKVVAEYLAAHVGGMTDVSKGRVEISNVNIREEFLGFLVSDNGGEVNLTGLNWEAPAESIPYISNGKVISAAAMAHRIHKTLMQGQIDWSFV